jgi:hypothetical protein
VETAELKYDYLSSYTTKEGKWKKLLMKGTLVTSKWSNKYFNIAKTGIKEETIKTIHGFIAQTLKGKDHRVNFRPNITIT